MEPGKQLPTNLLWLLVRVPPLIVHMLLFLPLTVLSINPVGKRIAVGETHLADFMIRWWSATLCRIFGMRIQTAGTLRKTPVMLVANHVSWIDIEVLHGVRVFSFVAKAEIAKWPVVGPLARAGGSVFHSRGSHQSREDVTLDLARKLREGRSVALFPEGRTSTGAAVLPFHGRMFQAAIDEKIDIQPAALAYLRDGQLVNHHVAFAAKESFLGNFWRLLVSPPVEVVVTFGEPISTVAAPGRKEIANRARQDVVAALEVAPDWPSAAERT